MHSLGHFNSTIRMYLFPQEAMSIVEGTLVSALQRTRLFCRMLAGSGMLVPLSSTDGQGLGSCQAGPGRSSVPEEGLPRGCGPWAQGTEKVLR